MQKPLGLSSEAGNNEGAKGRRESEKGTNDNDKKNPNHSGATVAVAYNCGICYRGIVQTESTSRAI